MKKKLTKSRYIEFMSGLTGHTKSFVDKNLEIKKRPLATVFRFTSGLLTYDTWVLSDRIYTQYFLDRECQGAWFHEFDTLIYDWKFTEKERDRKE